MEHHELEAVIAAILAAGAVGSGSANAVGIVDAYRRVLKQLQDTGGPTPSVTSQRGSARTFTDP